MFHTVFRFGRSPRKTNRYTRWGELQTTCQRHIMGSETDSRRRRSFISSAASNPRSNFLSENAAEPPQKYSDRMCGPWRVVSLRNDTPGAFLFVRTGTRPSALFLPRYRLGTADGGSSFLCPFSRQTRDYSDGEMMVLRGCKVFTLQDNSHDPIVPKAVFYQVQGEKKRRSGLAKNPSKLRFGNRLALNGRCKSGSCWSWWTRRWNRKQRNKHGAAYRQYY